MHSAIAWMRVLFADSQYYLFPDVLSVVDMLKLGGNLDSSDGEA